jgi:hypothetical protein
LVGQLLALITRIFGLNDFFAELWPLIEKGVNKVHPVYSSYTTNEISIKFYRIDGSSSSCAWYTSLPIE